MHGKRMAARSEPSHPSCPPHSTLVSDRTNLPFLPSTPPRRAWKLAVEKLKATLVPLFPPKKPMRKAETQCKSDKAIGRGRDKVDPNKDDAANPAAQLARKCIGAADHAWRVVGCRYAMGRERQVDLLAMQLAVSGARETACALGASWRVCVLGELRGELGWAAAQGI